MQLSITPTREPRLAFFTPAMLPQILNAIPAAVLVVDTDESVVHANIAARELLGSGIIHGGDPEGSGALYPLYVAGTNMSYPRERLPVARALRGARAAVEDVEVDHPRGRMRLRVEGIPIVGGHGEAVLAAALLFEPRRRRADRTLAEQRQRELDVRLQQARKLDTVGRLAAGVAHDVNTLLTVISANAQFMRDALTPGGPGTAEVEEILQAVTRGSRLTRTLLGYGQPRDPHPLPVDVNEVVGKIAETMRRVIGDRIELTVALEPDVGKILMDETQLEQVVMNLMVNARDAIPGAGELSVRTARAWLDAEVTGGTEAGVYAELTVADSGNGMTPEIARRIFDPYFSTKDEHGVGLGLATVDRIVRDARGHVVVHTEPGSGTRFSVYFPLLGTRQQQPAGGRESGDLPRGSETVLVVDDDESLCTVLTRMLELQDYRVLCSGHGSQAMRLLRELTEPLHLVIADVVAPDGGARDLLEALSESQPTARLLLMSGYADDQSRMGLIGPGVSFIAKPYTREQMVYAVREILDAPELVAG